MFGVFISHSRFPEQEIQADGTHDTHCKQLLPGLMALSRKDIHVGYTMLYIVYITWLTFFA